MRNKVTSELKQMIEGALVKAGGEKYLVNEKALLEDGWNQIREEVEVKLVSLPGGTETYVLCRSTSRREKERAIRHPFSQRLEQALGRLHQRVTQGRLKDRTKIEQALASLRARHPRVADLYQMSVVEREGTVEVKWQRREERQAWREAREGAYLLRTNLTGESAAELWNKYIQLTEAEAAFRALKSALLIRPLFHQLERRLRPTSWWRF